MVPQPDAPAGVVFVTARSVTQLRSCPIVVLMELKRSGWAVVPIVEGVFPLEATGIAELDKFLGCITLDGEMATRKLIAAGKNAQQTETYDVSDVRLEDVSLEEEADTTEYLVEAVADFEDGEPLMYNREEGKVSWHGVDLSRVLLSEHRVSQYSVDTTSLDSAILGKLEKSLRDARVNAKVLYNLHSAASGLELKAACLIGSDVQLSNAIYQTYCEAFGDPEAFFCIQAVSGDQGTLAAPNVALEDRCFLENVTKHPNIDSGSFSHLEAFHTYYARSEQGAMSAHQRQFAHQQAVEFVESTAYRDVGTALRSGSEKILKARIQSWKEAGGNIACLFAQSAYEPNTLLNGGVVHNDVQDWLNHTINSVSGQKTLLLIQPDEYAAFDNVPSHLSKRVLDLLDAELPDNVVLLDRGAFAISDLAEFVDLGLVYHDIAALKLGIMGVPCVLSAQSAMTDFPIGHIAPVSRDDYVKYVRFEKTVQVASDFKEKSASWLAFARSDDFAPSYRYHTRRKGNGSLQPSWWVQEDIRRYLMEGDQAISSLVQKVILDV